MFCYILTVAQLILDFWGGYWYVVVKKFLTWYILLYSFIHWIYTQTLILCKSPSNVYLKYLWRRFIRYRGRIFQLNNKCYLPFLFICFIYLFVYLIYISWLLLLKHCDVTVNVPFIALNIDGFIILCCALNQELIEPWRFMNLSLGFVGYFGMGTWDSKVSSPQRITEVQAAMETLAAQWLFDAFWGLQRVSAWLL